jgi:hypothetical protein
MILEDIRKLIMEQVADEEHLLLRGVATDYAGYTNMVGRIAGLRLALDLILEVEKKFMDED